MTAAAVPLTAGAERPLAPATDSLALAGQHFAAAMMYLLAGAAGLVWIAPDLAAGLYTTPRVAGITHLFTLGWLTTTILGALHQLLPVALGAPLRSARVGHLSFWTFVPGAGLFAAGIATSVTALHHAGVGLVAAGVLLAAGNIALTLPRARARDATWAAIAIALAFLVSTLGLGVVLLHNLHTGFLAAARLRVLSTHLHVALVGWALIMMVGVAHRLLPMFLLAHGADTRWTARAITFLAAGVVALAAGLLGGIATAAWLGALLLDAGVACFVWQAFAFHRVRVKKVLDVGMRFVAVALGFLVTSALLGPAVLAMGPAHPRLAASYVVTGLLGGIVLFVVGFFYKIVPLLAWTVRYRGRMGQGPVTTVAAMYSARVAHVQLALMSLGVVLLATGIAAGSAHVTRCGALLVAAGVLAFASQIARVALGGTT